MMSMSLSFKDLLRYHNPIRRSHARFRCAIIASAAVLVLYIPTMAQWCTGTKGGYPNSGNCNYRTTELNTFLKAYGSSKYLRKDTLTKSTDGRIIELLHLGRIDGGAKWKFYIQARQHSDEWKPNYVLEGIMKVVLDESNAEGKFIRENVEIALVPFVNKDNVEVNSNSRGDDGYGDLNRIWNVSLTSLRNPAVREAKRFMAEWGQGKLVLAIDFHCPGAIGGSGFSHSIWGGNKFVNNGKRLAQLMNSNRKSRNISTTTFSAATSDKMGVFKYYGESLPGMWFSATLEFAEMETQIADCQGYGRDLIHGATLWTQAKQNTTNVIAAARVSSQRHVAMEHRLFQINGREIPDRAMSNSRSAAVMIRQDLHDGLARIVVR